MKTMNQLVKLYESFKATLNVPEPLGNRLSAPLLLHPTKRWDDARKKVLIVGQETKGWGGYSNDVDNPDDIHTLSKFKFAPDSVDVLMHEYAQWNFALGSRPYGSPFWKAYRQIRRSFDDKLDGLETATLWTNLFRVDLDEGSVVNNSIGDELEAIQKINRGLLSKEIAILNPTAVIFFTGPNYNVELEQEFTDISYKRLNDHELTRSARLLHPTLPTTAIRTYHPAYLQRSNQWGVIDKIEGILSRL